MAELKRHKSNAGEDFDALVEGYNKVAGIVNTWAGANVDLANEIKADYNTARTLINELKTDFNLLLAKLDADTGTEDENYAATLAIAASDAPQVTTADASAGDFATLINEVKADYNTARTLINELKTDFNLLLAKLDADIGVTDEDYVADLTISAADAPQVTTADAVDPTVAEGEADTITLVH